MPRNALSALVCLSRPPRRVASDLHSPIRKDLTTRISHQLDFLSVFPCASGLLSTAANSKNTALSPVVSALAPNPGMSNFSRWNLQRRKRDLPRAHLRFVHVTRWFFFRKSGQYTMVCFRRSGQCKRRDLNRLSPPVARITPRRRRWALPGMRLLSDLWSSAPIIHRDRSHGQRL